MSRRKAAIEWAKILGTTAKAFNEIMSEGGMFEDGKVTDEADGYYEIMNNGYGTIKWDPEALDMAGYPLTNIDWYCDKCNNYLNDQSNFVGNGICTCQKCGYKNVISASNII